MLNFKIYLFDLLKFLLLTILFSPAYGQLKKIEVPLQFGHIGFKEGLSENWISCMLCDDQGLMWFGTGDGLFQYNGTSVIPFSHNPKDSCSIAPSQVNALLQDDDGLIYIALQEGGLDVFDKKTGKFIHYTYKESDSTSIGSKQVYCLSKGDHDHIWVGTIGGWFDSFDKRTKKFTRYRSPANDSTLKFLQNTLDIHYEQPFVWLAAPGSGLTRFDPEKKSFTAYRHSDDPNSILNNGTIWISKSSNGNLWLSSAFGGGIEIFDKKTEIFRRPDFPKYKNSLTVDQSYPITFEDSKGRIWIGTTDSGLILLNEKEGSYAQFLNDANSPNSICENSVRCMTEDRNGNIWFGTYARGVNILYNRKNPIALYQSFTKDNNPSRVNKIIFIRQAPDGKIWIATDDGLKSFDLNSGKFNSEEKINQLLESVRCFDISSVAFDQDGSMWIGSFQSGLNFIDLKKMKITSYNHEVSDSPTIGDLRISTVLVDRDGLVWIGTQGAGVNVIDKKMGKIIHYKMKLDNSLTLSSNNIFNLFEDHKGIIGIATWDRGLNSFDKKTNNFTRYNENASYKNPTINNPIVPVFEDSKNHLWIGTAGAGLYLLDLEKKEFQNYSVADGLPSNAIRGILEDDRGFLWISTERGLCRFAPPGTESDVALRFYDLNDGIQGYIFWDRSQCKTKDGRLLFGGSGGLNVISPNILQADSALPGIVFADFKLFGRHLQMDTTIGYKKIIRLNYKQNFFTIEFSSMNLTASGENFYGYQIQGLSDSIISLEKSKSISFTNVNPGTYTFKVWYLNSASVWNKNYSYLTLIISPPFWRTLWFYILCALLFAGIAYSIYNYRLKQILKLQNIRNKIAGDLHDDIGSTLSSIAIYSELVNEEMKEKSEKASSLLETISENARTTVESMSDIVWAINPKNDRFENILIRMRTFASGILEAKNIDLRFEASSSLSELKLQMEERKNLYLILKEAVNNVAKYSGCENCTIRLWQEGKMLNMEIADDGLGFDINNYSAGNGLLNMKKRGKEMNGQFSFQSAKGTGTTIHLSFPAT
ncbi:MAG TPA: two-component regulator propeller domain-containing protein [Chitinophagales bacterium]|nr:two-component regulator propeller domain-containing protein [Chitinophagales bacterium]